MAVQSPTRPVEDSVPKVNNEIAVGSDLEFQRKWWRFERAIWILFAVIEVLALFGAFGRGFLAQGRMRSANGLLDVHYERVERFNTPSVITVAFGQAAVHDGVVQLWASEDLVKPLGNQRVIPQPRTSTLDRGGILYTFDTGNLPFSVEFSLTPAIAGISTLILRVPNTTDEVAPKIVVMP